MLCCIKSWGLTAHARDTVHANATRHILRTFEETLRRRIRLGLVLALGLMAKLVKAPQVD